MTTRRFITSAVLTATLLASRYTMLRAESGGEEGLPACCCAYSMWTCTYNDGSYFTDCDPTFPSGQLWTFMARARCGKWYPAP